MPGGRATRRNRISQVGPQADRAMETDSTLRVLDFALRGAEAALLLLIAGLLVREYGGVRAARLGAAFAIGVTDYVICAAPGSADHTELWRAPILGLCSGNAVVFWRAGGQIWSRDAVG
jgi:hypothetical protein